MAASGTLKGMGSFCLVDRQELPSSTGNLVQFEDIDRDGMIDMLYVDRNDYGLTLNVHYNRLLNADREKDKNKIESAFSVIAAVCSDTDRPVPSLTDMYFPIKQVQSVLDADGLVTTDRVVRSKVYSD